MRVAVASVGAAIASKEGNAIVAPLTPRKNARRLILFSIVRLISVLFP